MSVKNQKKNEKRQINNRRHKTLIKNKVKSLKILLGKEKNEEVIKEIKETFSLVQRCIDKAKNKKVIHRNKADRRKSRLQKLISQSV
jgi:small subunit ribosomal protein S20